MTKDPASETASPAGEPPLDPETAAAAADRRFFGHPLGLANLFLTEFWERFTYYGMRGNLILFMTAAVAAGGLGMSDARAGAVYGLYTAGVYLFALPGGWLADQLLGQRRAVYLGGFLIAAGNIILYLQPLTAFYLGLVVIVLGVGLLKPNVSTMVGELYPGTTPEAGARRDAGFSIFYMGINLGAFLSPLVCGWIGKRIDWRLSFLVAGLGMVIGLVQYRLTRRWLGNAGLHPSTAADPAAQRRSRRILGYGALAVAAILGVLYLVQNTIGLTIEALAGAAGVVIVVLAILYLVLQLTSGGLDAVEKKRMTVIFVLFIFSALFWSGFEQAGSSLNLFAERLTDLDVFGWNMPAPWLQAVNPILIIALAPVFAWLWVALSRRKLEPSSPAKFSLGLIFLGLGFGVMVWAAILTVNQTRQVSALWLTVTYLFHTIGELCLSPVGLSTVTKLAPHRKVGQMMGIWFMSISLGNLIAGIVAGGFATLPLPQLFGAVFATTAGAGLVLALLVRPIRRLMTGVH